MFRPRFIPARAIRLTRPVQVVRRNASNMSEASSAPEASNDTSHVSGDKPRTQLPINRVPGKLKIPSASEPSSNTSKPTGNITKKSFIESKGAKFLMTHPLNFGDELEIKIKQGNIELDMKPRMFKSSLLWLRDVCPCPKCVDPHSGQKSFSLVDLPASPQVQSAEKTEDGSLKVVWKNDGVMAGESNHESIYPRHKLVEWANDYQVRQPQKLRPIRQPWNRAHYTHLLESGATKISYKDWTTNREAFYRAFAALAHTGLIFITDVPHGETEVERIGNQIGMLQHTFYGTTWDVKSKPQAENVAYTSQFLGLHQDLMYHDPVPRLQILHCLENSCQGGESLFSDGLYAALSLKLYASKSYNLLKQPRWFFGYDKEPHHYERCHPVIDVGDHEYIRAIHWAPPFQTPFQRSADQTLHRLRRAAKNFEHILSRPKNMLEVKLNPGEAVIFDNWRILHGRREFAADSGGSRWLKGAYITDQVFRALDDKRPRQPDDYEVWPLPDAPAFRAQAAEDELERFLDPRNKVLSP
ncbi:hypothetical protein V8F20_004078 [Naviculisporaceae sp. PSN 640]